MSDLIDPGPIIAELEERLARGKADATESFRQAHNSYGAGWDNGYVVALEAAIRLLRGEEP